MLNERLPGADPFLVREPVMGRTLAVMGYQLRTRPCQSPGGDQAAVDLLTLYGPEGVVELAGGLPAFVPVGRSPLLGGLPPLKFPQSVVIELPATLEASREIRQACRDLRTRGYRVALSGFWAAAPAGDLASGVDYLKLDVGDVSDAAARVRTVVCFQRSVTALIATGVDSFDICERAAREGFTHFQGFFMGRPALLPPGRAAWSPGLLRLLAVLNDPLLSTGQLEDLVKHDATLCYRLLQAANSAARARQAPVHSIREALLLIGRDAVRRWVSAWLMVGAAIETHAEAAMRAAVRARFCELIAAHTEASSAEAFLVGLCSMLDVMAGQPMDRVLADVPLSAPVRAALLGETGVLRSIVQCARSYEQARWADAEAHAAVAGIQATRLPGAFVEALRWSAEFRRLDRTTRVAS